MTLNQLECFMVLAQRLNFTQAADDLFMAQPALSRLISALEKELDVQLFYRNSRSVALTPAGSAFFKECPKILDEYRGSVVAARLAQEGYRGSLSLGIMRDTFEPKLSEIYQQFHTAYPQVSMMVRGYSHSNLLSALEREGIQKAALVVFGQNEGGNAFWEHAGFTARTDLVYRNRNIHELKKIET